MLKKSISQAATLLADEYAAGADAQSTYWPMKADPVSIGRYSSFMVVHKVETRVRPVSVTEPILRGNQ